MTPSTIDTTRYDDLDARTWRISEQILGGIEQTLADMAQPPALRAAIERAQMLNEARCAAQARCAPLLCRHAMCRRAQCCRRQPCAVPKSVFEKSAFDRAMTHRDRGR